MKKIILALATFGLAFTFTACGDDSSSGKSGTLKSCDTKTEMEFMGEKFETHSCVEGYVTADEQKDLEEMCVGLGELVKQSVGNGCESGAKKTCEDKEGAKYYFYDEDDAKKSCEVLIRNDDDDFADDDDDDDLNGSDDEDSADESDDDDSDDSDDASDDEE